MTTAARIDWRTVLHGPPSTVPGLHWHGYLWIGRGSLLESYKTQAQRNPGTLEFDSSDLPPESTRHYLLKRRRLLGTFTTPVEAAAWMRRQWDENTPTSTHLDPDDSQQYHEVTLSHQKDSIWSWWQPAPGSGTKVHVAAICCPNEVPDVPCPQPPSR
jgi:hypothetical protein